MKMGLQETMEIADIYARYVKNDVEVHLEDGIMSIWDYNEKNGGASFVSDIIPIARIAATTEQIHKAIDNRNWYCVG